MEEVAFVVASGLVEDIHHTVNTVADAFAFVAGSYLKQAADAVAVAAADFRANTALAIADLRIAAFDFDHKKVGVVQFQCKALKPVARILFDYYERQANYCSSPPLVELVVFSIKCSKK